jgi:hypothetical protein
MGQLSADSVLAFETNADIADQPVTDNVIIYRGSAVGSLAGYARQLVAGDTFLGFAEQKVDNTATGHASGAKNVPVRRKGYAQLSVGSLAVTDIGKAVYASDGATFTLTQSTNSRIGTVHRYISSGVGIVKFDVGAALCLGGITVITDSTTGAASGNTIDDTTTSVKDDLACLARKINEIIAFLKM